MDPDVEIMYKVPSGTPVTRNRLQVRLSKEFNRKLLLCGLENTVDSVWERRCAENPKLWNGTKFRLDSAYDDQNGTFFNLGITCYKEYIGTNWSPKAKLYQEMGMKDFCNSQVYMSDALGVGALVETADSCIILLRRSQHCGEAVGLLDIPGGHPEPQELVGRIPAANINLDKLSANDVVNEIFNSIVREICDEVNIPIDQISDPELLGVARNTTSAGRPSSEYYVRCRLTSDEIKKQYSKGDHSEAEESTAIHLVPLADVMTAQDCNQPLWMDLAPSAKGCVLLYKLTRDETAEGSVLEPFL